MLDNIHVSYDILVAQALQDVSAQCFRMERGDGTMAQAAVEAQAMARELNGAVLHVNLSGSQLLCAAMDALRANQRQDLAERLDAIIALIKGRQNRVIVGSAIIGMKKVMDQIGASSANILLAEHPESGDTVKIAEVK